MFYTLHKAVKLLTLLAFLGVAWKLYERRAIFEPVEIWYQVWENGGFKTRDPIRTIGGRVVRIINSQTFVIRPRENVRYNVRLMGLAEPDKTFTPRNFDLEIIRKKALEDLLLDNWIHVELLHENGDSIGGCVFLNSTNLNAHLVQQRLAKTSPRTIAGMPRDHQYALLYASRHPAPDPIK